MTVELYGPEVYLGNGSLNEYDFGFKVFSKAHLGVFVRDTSDSDAIDIQLELDVDFSVSDASVNNDDGGTITLIDSSQDWIDSSSYLASDWRLVIKRYIPVEQATDLKNQGSFYAKNHEDAFDYFIMVAQQQQDAIDRCLRIPDTYDSTDFNLTFPASFIGQINVVLMTNATGDGFAAGPSAASIAQADAILETAVASAAAAAVSAAAAAVSAAASAGSGVSDEAYDATTWNGVTGTAPSKNAVRDKIEAVVAALVSDTAYDEASWNAVTTVAPSKNVVRDFFESIWAAAKTFTNKTINGPDNTLTNIAKTSVDSTFAKYLPKAWVNFNGVPKTGTYSQTGTTITVTMSSHGMTTGQYAGLRFTSGTASDNNGTYAITNTGTNTFTVTVPHSHTTSGNATRDNYIRSSVNVASITDGGAGLYTVVPTVNFADTNYAASILTSLPTGNGNPTPVILTLAVNGLSFELADASTGSVEDATTVCVTIFGN